MTETVIISERGEHQPFEFIVLATAFQVQNFLAPIEIIGKTEETLHGQWASQRGAQAYMGTFVHSFPNFAMLQEETPIVVHVSQAHSSVFNKFGPNTFPAFNSVIFAVEVQVAYIAKTLMAPIVDSFANVIESQAAEEEKFVMDLDERLAGTVFAAGYSNWYINSVGRNAATWPGFASSSWAATFFPKWRALTMSGGSKA